jgi:hypothetical protein
VIGGILRALAAVGQPRAAVSFLARFFGGRERPGFASDTP